MSNYYCAVIPFGSIDEVEELFEYLELTGKIINLSEEDYNKLTTPNHGDKNNG